MLIGVSVREHIPMNRTAICKIALVATMILALPITGASAAAPSGPSVPAIKPGVDGILDLFQTKSIVVLCDYHGMAQEEAFFSQLVRDPRFAAEVGNVIVEFGESSQPIIDRYVAGAEVPLTELRRVWTDTAGRAPGPFWLGYVNFFAAVRSANSELPPDRRVKIWLGDPKYDWSAVKSYQDLVPYLLRRDDNFLRIINDDILKKQRKALLIIGSGHIFGAGLLKAKLDAAYPHSFATVMPFVGYLERNCNDRFLSVAQSWPNPALIGPVAGTWLRARLQLPGCNFVAPQEIRAVLATPAPKTLPPGFVTITSAHELINVVSGEDADAILYLGAPDTLTESPYDPDIYLDPSYFREEDRHSRCCTRAGQALNWDRILQANSVVPRKLPRY
jgi:hypothetical protein